jgi:type IV secretory pathway VirB10-like protein
MADNPLTPKPLPPVQRLSRAVLAVGAGVVSMTLLAVAFLTTPRQLPHPQAAARPPAPAEPGFLQHPPGELKPTRAELTEQEFLRRVLARGQRALAGGAGAGGGAGDGAGDRRWGAAGGGGAGAGNGDALDAEDGGAGFGGGAGSPAGGGPLRLTPTPAPAPARDLRREAFLRALRAPLAQAVPAAPSRAMPGWPPPPEALGLDGAAGFRGAAEAAPRQIVPETAPRAPEGTGAALSPEAGDAGPGGDGAGTGAAGAYGGGGVAPWAAAGSGRAPGAAPELVAAEARAASAVAKMMPESAQGMAAVAPAPAGRANGGAGSADWRSWEGAGEGGPPAAGAAAGGVAVATVDAEAASSGRGAGFAAARLGSRRGGTSAAGGHDGGRGARGQVTLPAGTVIPALLLTAVNSDLPGPLMAQVSRDVYDLAQRTVVLPRGTRLLGRYEHQVAVGQRRLLVAWTRLQLLDGTLVEIPGLPGADAGGAAGLPGRVQNHLLRVFGDAVLLSLLAAGADLSQPPSRSLVLTPSAGSVAGAAVGQQLADVGIQLLRRDLAIQPTLRLAAGTPLTVFVNGDLALPGVAVRSGERP